MKRNTLSLYFVAVFIFLILLSCSSVDKKELKVIDDVQIGISVNEYDNLLTSLNIERANFLSSIVFMVDKVSSHSLNLPYTQNFDFSDFRSENNRHLGLFYPSTIAGTDNITSLAVILVHTEKPFFVFPKEVEPENIDDDNTSISQNISIRLVDAIERMYISKYGNAKDTITKAMFMNLYKIQGNDIKSYKPPDYDGIYQEIVWETKYLKIKLFKGIQCTEEKYDTKTNQYKYSVGANADGILEMNKIVIDWDNGETMCVSYPYIEYELKPEVIEKLKLDKKKI